MGKKVTVNLKQISQTLEYEIIDENGNKESKSEKIEPILIPNDLFIEDMTEAFVNALKAIEPCQSKE